MQLIYQVFLKFNTILTLWDKNSDHLCAFDFCVRSVGMLQNFRAASGDCPADCPWTFCGLSGGVLLDFLRTVCRLSAKKPRSGVLLSVVNPYSERL